MICLIGGKGSIGSRYACILRASSIPHVVYDVDTPDIDLFSYNKYILATPTDTHAHYLRELEGATILCEKPVSKKVEEILPYPKVYVVNNYAYVTRLMKQEPPYMISYDYFRTGKDGLLWDVCQLIHLDPECEIRNQSPKWNCTINGQRVAYRTLEESYIRMIKDFHDGNYQNLWNMEDGKQMTLEVLERIKNVSQRTR